MYTAMGGNNQTNDHGKVKAFDSLCHSALLKNLQNFRTSKGALGCNWFGSYLLERQQTTHIGQSLSKPLIVAHDVTQGSILGTMLFSFYFNDLPSVLRNFHMGSYVDKGLKKNSGLTSLWCRCSVLPTELSSQLGAGHVLSS